MCIACSLVYSTVDYPKMLFAASTTRANFARCSYGPMSTTPRLTQYASYLLRDWIPLGHRGKPALWAHTDPTQHTD